VKQCKTLQQNQNENQQQHLQCKTEKQKKENTKNKKKTNKPDKTNPETGSNHSKKLISTREQEKAQLDPGPLPAAATTQSFGLSKKMISTRAWD
jgi:hypothetical protein